MNKNISIKWKIFLYLIGFLGILLFLLWMFQIAFLDEFYKEIKIDNIKKISQEIEQYVENDSSFEDIDNIVEKQDIDVDIFNTDASIAYSSNSLDRMFIRINLDEIYEKAKNNGGEFLEISVDDKKEFGQNKRAFIEERQFLTLINISKNKNGEDVIIMIKSIISPVNATTETLRVQLLYITAFMLILSVILALLISRKVSKPIEELNKSTKFLAKGDYFTKFEGTGYREIEELSDSLNKAAVELSKVEELRRELIANISHDLRTPLTLIGGYAEVMRDIPEENNSENAQIIMDETKRLTSLVNDVLDIGKYESGKIAVNKEKYNFTKSVKSTIDRLNELLKKDEYSIIFNYNEEVNIVADENKITQALYNLLINAINYTGKDKKVIVNQEIVTKDNKKRVIIHVIDTGEGIEKEKIPYIWERYYKDDKNHKRAIAGTGLGLSIVKGIISMHEGEYGVISEKEKGSDFYFEIDTI